MAFLLIAGWTLQVTTLLLLMLETQELAGPNGLNRQFG